jgi:TetR/AcrR family transcriptional regulator, regulator of cefoperazone and chloramphenicol sensitivity
MRTGTAPRLASDLTAKARVREAALELFAERGFDATTVRHIAAHAGVSPGLVIHHFGSKQGVRDAVDESVIAHFDAALDAVPLGAPAEVIGRTTGDAFGSVIAASPVLRAYLRRALLEGDATGQRVVGRLVEALEAGIARMADDEAVRPAVRTRWLPFQILFNSLGSLVFEPFLAQRMGVDPYEPDVLAERQAANLDLMAPGMFAPERP